MKRRTFLASLLALFGVKGEEKTYRGAWSYRAAGCDVGFDGRFVIEMIPYQPTPVEREFFKRLLKTIGENTLNLKSCRE